MRTHVYALAYKTEMFYPFDSTQSRNESGSERFKNKKGIFHSNNGGYLHFDVIVLNRLIFYHESIEAVKATGLADEIIVEEYEGQKIDDIRKYDVDIFTVGSDWAGKFDYLKEYCKVVYLDRTEGVSSSEIREEKRQIRLGLVGDSTFLNKVFAEAQYVNGIHVNAVYTSKAERMVERLKSLMVNDYEHLLENVDAVYSLGGFDYSVGYDAEFIILRQVINFAVATFVFMSGYFVPVEKICNKDFSYKDWILNRGGATGRTLCNMVIAL